MPTMRNNPLVSVIIPTYNRAGVIDRTIADVFNQTYKNLELIVVDDGSTDDTLARLRRHGDRIRVLSQANAGPAVARNRGAEVARGEILAFQDSDDLWKPDKIERQVALLEKLGPSVPCCLCNIVMGVVKGKEWTSFDLSLIRPKHDEGIWLNVPEVLATRFVMFNQAAAIRRDAWEKVGGFSENLKYLEDYDLPLRLALEGPWGIIREPLVVYGEDSPESFSKAALKEPIVLKECEVKICESMLAKANDRNRYASFRRHLKRRLGIARRHLVSIRLSKTKSAAARAAGRLLRFADHYRMAAFRRSPWFPQPKTLPIAMH